MRLSGWLIGHIWELGIGYMLLYAIMKISMSILWIALFTASPYALDYRIKDIKLLPVESYPAKTTISGVTIAADPYDSNEKSASAFDVKKMNSEGYFPLHVIIENNSESFLKIRTLNVTLITESGQQLYTTPATIVVDDIFGGGFSRRIPLVGSSDLSTSNKTGSPLWDFTNKELTNRFLDPGTVTAGFLFFYGWGSLRSALRGGNLDTSGGAARSLRAAIMTTLAVTLLNPHFYLDTVILLGSVSSQFHGENRLFFWAGAISASTLWFICLCFGGRMLAPLFKKQIAWRILDSLVCATMWTIALSLIMGGITV